MFQESTRLRYNRLVLALLPILVGATAVLTYFIGKPGLQPWLFAVLAIGVALQLGLIGLLMFGGLDIEVGDARLTYRYRPLTKTRVIDGADIESVEAIEYRPIADFGGWGIRSGRGGVRAYTVRGNRGVVITRRDGSSLMFGSDSPEELAAAIEAIRS